MKRWTFLAFFVGMAGVCPLGTQAQGLAGEGYALVVGSNLGGRGQASLRYAEEDASRVADVLTTLGGYAPNHVQRLVRPSAAALLAAIDSIRQQVVTLAQAGTQSRFFFYYSGHARADALNLGGEELPLAVLREKLLGLPATISIVVLDACQSGAFSRVKGASPTTDFSFNSIDRLNTAGIAVVASSSGKELSQESETLRSSYFTHHWLVALRGAGDRDADGRVTLSEAYQYAYNHTLATTAETSVGEQHATLETNLKGKDDIALTQPRAATAHLRLLSPFEGRVLVQSLPSWSVLAELDKAAGQPIVLALPAGNYAATIRRAGQASRCSLWLRDGSETVLAASECAPLRLETAETKGGGLRTEDVHTFVPDGREEGWILELTLGVGSNPHHDEFVQRLNDFSLHRQSDDLGRFEINIGRRLQHHFLVGLGYFNIGSAEYRRDREVPQGFGWNAHALGPFLQGDLTVGRRRLLNFFARAGAGVSIAWTSFDAIVTNKAFTSSDPAFENTTTSTKTVAQHFVRPCGWLAAGMQIMPWREFGFQFELRYTYAPAIENAFGEVHDVGGVAFTTGMRIRTWE